MTEQNTGRDAVSVEEWVDDILDDMEAGIDVVIMDKEEAQPMLQAIKRKLENYKKLRDKIHNQTMYHSLEKPKVSREGAEELYIYITSAGRTWQEFKDKLTELGIEVEDD